LLARAVTFVLGLVAVPSMNHACTDAPTCTVPPSERVSGHAGQGRDVRHALRLEWLGSQAAVQDLWEGLKCQTCDLGRGLGPSTTSATSISPLTRLLNGGQLRLAGPAVTPGTPAFGLWAHGNPPDYGRRESISRDAGGPTSRGTGGRVDAGLRGQERRALPGYGRVQHPCTSAGRLPLTRGGPVRAPLVHETVHQDVSHVAKDDCSPERPRATRCTAHTTPTRCR
jgi:hypothetical protein